MFAWVRLEVAEAAPASAPTSSPAGEAGFLIKIAAPHLDFFGIEHRRNGREAAPLGFDRMEALRDTSQCRSRGVIIGTAQWTVLDCRHALYDP